MNFYFIGLLIAAWILTLFDFDEHFIKGFNELTSKSITISGYYLMFFLIGLSIDLFEILRGK